MFVYEKKLQYPVRIANPNPKLAGRTESWEPPCGISASATPCHTRS